MDDGRLLASARIPAGALLALAVLGIPGGPASAAPEVPYDRTDTGRTTPFPDDSWLVPDGTTPTGLRVVIPVPDREPDVQQIFQALINGTVDADGFSPIGGIVVELSEAPAEATLPLDAAASLAPLAPIGLFDLTPGDPRFGERVPFQLRWKAMAYPNQPFTHTLVIFPSIPLAPTHRYGLVITRRLESAIGHAFEPSAFFAAALGPPTGGEAQPIARVRALAGEVIAGVGAVDPGFLADGVALALRITTRSLTGLSRDPLDMRQQLLARPAPAVVVTDVRPGTGPVAAIVSGTWEAPIWLGDGTFLQRDATGTVVLLGSHAIPFTLALPVDSPGPAPVTIMLHGSSSTAENDVPYVAQENGFAAAGIALLGFTGYFSREIGLDQATQNLAMFLPLYAQGRNADYWTQLLGEQLAFLRVASALADLDVLPLGAPDGIPDLDLVTPLTLAGYSAGSVEAAALLPYAPEIRAAALLAGSARFTDQMVHQDQIGILDFFRTVIPSFLPNVTPPDLWAGLSIYQISFDRQDANNHAAGLYHRATSELGTPRRASVLVIEGLGDSSTPNSATRSLAWTIGPIPQLAPAPEPVPFLASRPDPIVANIDEQTTAALVQFVPSGIPGIAPSPGCELVREGHRCAQDAPGSREQVVRFLQTARSDTAPTISATVPEPGSGALALAVASGLYGLARIRASKPAMPRRRATSEH